jgi:AraC-like DNA-binding protein
MTPQLIVGTGRVLFVGELESLPLHCAAADALLIGLSNDFELGISGATQSCRVALVPALTQHTLLTSGSVAVLYFEPGEAIDGLESLRLSRAVDQALQQDSASAWRELLIHSPLMPRPRRLDARIERVVRHLDEHSADAVSASAVAQSLGLSVSRLEHLFREQIGIPLRSYRKWRRIREASQRLLVGATVTEAAHAAGFYDAAHFSHTFRRQFGVTPSSIFARSLKAQMVGP